MSPLKPSRLSLLVLLCLLIGPPSLPALSLKNPVSLHRLHLPLLLNEFQPSPSLPGWLSSVNYYRSTAGLPPVSEKAEWSAGNHNHAIYMVRNDVIEHDEDPGNPWYTPEGRAAAQNSNLIVSFDVQATPIGGNTRTRSAVAPVITLPAAFRLSCSSDRVRSPRQFRHRPLRATANSWSIVSLMKRVTATGTWFSRTWDERF